MMDFRLSNREPFCDAINQWCYGKACGAALKNVVRVGNELCYYSDNTTVYTGERNNIQIVIIGTCVDASGQWEQGEIAQRLAAFEMLDKFIGGINSLCGTFVVFRCEDGKLSQVFGDATHMMSIYYGVTAGVRGVIASCEALIVDDVKDVSDNANEVVQGYYVLHQFELVGDMTMYDTIRCLLPNHYLDAKRMLSIRYFPSEKMVQAKRKEEVDDIIDRTVAMCSCVVKQFARTMKFASPLTEGADSRVNCALLRTTLASDDTAYYIVRNGAVTACPQVISFVKSLAVKMGIDEFRVFPDEKVLSEQDVAYLKESYGAVRAWGEKIWTYNPQIENRVIVNGQVIGQIGQAYMKTWPAWMANKRFMRIKMGNTSSVAFGKFSEWYDDAKHGSKGYSLYDLWGWEIRCGRWNSNLISMNSILGLRDISFYNCRKILQDWCRIPRRLRGQHVVHLGMIERLMPDIKDIPINPFVVKSRHLPACVNKIVPVVCQEIANYILATIKK